MMNDVNRSNACQSRVVRIKKLGSDVFNHPDRPGSSPPRGHESRNRPRKTYRFPHLLLGWAGWLGSRNETPERGPWSCPGVSFRDPSSRKSTSGTYFQPITKWSLAVPLE